MAINEQLQKQLTLREQRRSPYRNSRLTRFRCNAMNHDVSRLVLRVRLNWLVGHREMPNRSTFLTTSAL